MNCVKCKKIILRSEGGTVNEDGLCEDCVTQAAEEQKITNDLLTAFGGSGKRGFVRWLEMGDFLEEITNEAACTRYNDRILVIKEMIGRNAYDKLVDKTADVILSLAKENPNE